MSESASSVLRQSRRSSISSDQVQEYLWVKLSRQGDARAFNRLVLKWETTVYNMAYRTLRDREEAAEATQEVFLLAFKNIRSFRQNSKFSTWLCRIAINYCVSRLKQRPPRTHLSLEDQNITTGSTKQLQIPQTQFSSLMRSEQRDNDILKEIDEKNKEARTAWLDDVREAIASSISSLTQDQQVELEAALSRLDAKISRRIQLAEDNVTTDAEELAVDMYRAISKQRVQDLSVINLRFDGIEASNIIKTRQTNAILGTLLQEASLRIK
jgi:RNA polymerase sigma-70 factor (ECF subfamily)